MSNRPAFSTVYKQKQSFFFFIPSAAKHKHSLKQQQLQVLRLLSIFLSATMESPTREPTSWVDNYLKKNNGSVSDEHFIRPTLRIRRYDFPGEFEELYSRFVSMLLVLDPRIFLNVMDDCFRDTIDVMNDPRLQQKLDEYLARRSEHYYNMNDINGSPPSKASREGDNGSRSRRSPRQKKKNQSHDRGVHFIDYNSPLNSNDSKRLRPASAGSARRRRRRSPRSPKNTSPGKKQYGQVQFNTDIKYGDWMKERTKLHSEKKKLQQEVESLKADALNRMNAQTKLAEDMESKIVKLQEEMSLLRQRVNQ